MESELKRIASLKKQKEIFKAKEQAIRDALKIVDTVNTNKITFSDDFEGDSTNNNDHKPKKRPQLFDDDDDIGGEDTNFNFSKSKKTKYRTLGNDDRFKINEKFLDENNDDIEKVEEKVESSKDENDIINEQQQQLEILENILGKPIIRKDDKHEVPKKTRQMIHYDPNDEEHKKHEIIHSETQPVSKKKKKKSEIVIEEPPPLPINNEVFYSVSNKLTETLKNQEGFSLLKTYGSASVSDNRDDENNVSQLISKTQSKFAFNFDAKNPFKYDSSDDEDENNENSTPHLVDKVDKKNILSNQSDKFFFTTDDPRFKDAVEFFNKSTLSDESFTNTRRQLKQIVRTKIRNNERKKGPFKRKLGSSKKR